MAKQTAELETITVKRATELLARNTNNRPINQANLQILMHDMQRENFAITGESVKISVTGNLLDGQHRLQAVVQTGIPLKTWVMTGLDDNAFKYIDTGKMRSAADVLALGGFTNSNQIAAVGRFIMVFKQGKYYDTAQSGKRQKLTNKDIMDFIEKKHKAIVDSVFVGYNPKNKLLPGSIMGGLHFIFKGIDEDQADDFCHRLAEGDNLTKGSPIYLLREHFIRNARAHRKMKPYEKMFLMCLAWNLYRKKSSATELRFDVGAPFPRPL